MEKSLNKSNPNDFLCAKDTSMFPLILPKDRPLVKKSFKYYVDDIIVFKKNEKLIAHRVIFISPRNNMLITKGDNNLRSDGKITKDQILGKTEVVKRGKDKVRLSHFYLSQSSAYFKQLKNINKAFVKNKLPYIVLKGLPLHIHFNHAPPQRLYLDADLLIKRKNFNEAKKILTKLGYREKQSRLFSKIVKNPTQITLIKDTEPFPTVIDLHLEPAIGFTKIRSFNQLIPSLELFEKYLFKNTQTVLINKTKFPLLSTNVLIVYLLIHLFHHNFKGPYRMQLIDSLIRNQKINWGEIKKIIYKFKLENFTYPGMLALERYYHTPISHEDISPTFGQKLISCAIIKFVSPFDTSSRAREGAMRFVFLIFLSPTSFVQKVNILINKDTWTYLLATIKSFFSRV